MAHTYSTDSPERRYIPFFIAASAIGATFVAFHFVAKYAVEIPWWASPPIDTMAFYGLFYWLFDQHIWGWQFVHHLRITKIPDLSGEWRGQVNPTPTNGVSAGLESSTEITLSIKQTWTTLMITAQTGLSRSRSISGSVIVDDEKVLSYEYMNEPSAAAPATMHVHHGTTRLCLNRNDTVLEGEYYSGRDRQNIGTIRVTRANS